MKAQQIPYTKKALFLCSVLMTGLFLLSPYALANNHARQGGFTGPTSAQGGFTGPGPNLIGVMQAKQLPDDTWVTLKGHILRHEGKDIYVFKDKSGEARIDIDDDAWGGLHISPQDFVELVGKVDKDWGGVEIEVEIVRKAR